MFFDSPVYIVFLTLTVALYWRLTHRQQNYFLLAASYFFYGWWDWRFLGLMAFSTCIDFLVGRHIEDSLDQKRKKALLLCSLVFNFSILGFFKYFNFFIDSFSGVASALGLATLPEITWKIVLPPAISFYTFQEVAYIVDVYKGRIRASRSLHEYALFVSLFPHLIAGPIQQPSHLLPQVQKSRTWSYSSSFDGIMLIIEGLFRKVVIADNCALLANAAFDGRLGTPSAWTTMIGTYAFAFQIYGDFSGYSSIARGSAQLLGFHFMVNFRQPYLSQSLQEFWRRWHVSLSSWLRDYLYIPLGGSRKGTVRTYVNLLLTMLLGGLWHGANWTFVVWGAIHGSILSFERFLSGGAEVSSSAGFAARWIRRLLIFNVVCLAWIFFRSNSVVDAMHALRALGTWTWNPDLLPAAEFLGLYASAMLFVDLRLEKSGSEYMTASRGFTLRIAAALVLCVAVALFGANQANAFIYFQF